MDYCVKFTMSKSTLSATELVQFFLSYLLCFIKKLAASVNASPSSFFMIMIGGVFWLSIKYVNLRIHNFKSHMLFLL
jgi:hypothetical protein